MWKLRKGQAVAARQVAVATASVLFLKWKGSMMSAVLEGVDDECDDECGTRARWRGRR